ATNVRNEKRKAERRKTLIRILRNLRCGLHLAVHSPDGVPPRLSPGGLPVPKAQVQARLPGTWFARVLSALACPSPVEAPHRPVVMLVGMMPGPAREQQ